MSRYTARMIPRPAGEGWRKCPAVTYGGAPSFWTRRDPATDCRQWVTYNRIAGAWYSITEARDGSETRTLYPIGD